MAQRGLEIILNEYIFKYRKFRKIRVLIGH